MNNTFQPVLVSWQIPDPSRRWERLICRNQTELDYARSELKGIDYYEQRIYPNLIEPQESEGQDADSN